MTEVIMMCGVCGSGKTTFAKQKKREGYIRLSIDETMWKMYGQCGVDYPADEYDSLSNKAEKSLCNKVAELIRDGKKLVIDFSFWSKSNRDKYRKIITDNGGVPRLVYMKAEKEVLARRLEIRNKNIHADSPFVITDEILTHHFDGFQEPLAEENAEIILQF